LLDSLALDLSFCAPARDVGVEFGKVHEPGVALERRTYEIGRGGLPRVDVAGVVKWHKKSSLKHEA
jgi:hypothetical protein